MIYKSFFEQPQPLHIKNQLNGKSATENYKAAKEAILNNYYQKQQQKEQEKQLYDEVSEVIEKALNNIFIDF